MIFLHDSLLNPKFENDRKLSLLKNKVITIGQFVNLIDSSDNYILFGPAIIDKTKIKEFMIEWRNHQLNIDSNIDKKIALMTPDDVIANLEKIMKIFPEIEQLYNEYKEDLKTVICSACSKKRYLTLIASKIKEINDGRDLGDMRELIDTMIKKYTNGENEASSIDYTEYDVEWINPESLKGIGYDLIEKLDACFECVIKHLGRAKILYEEFNLGYPDHKEILLEEIANGNKDLEQWYLKYLDACSQLDMGSSELVGNMKTLDKEYSTEILELANEIRKQRILFQEDISKTPDFDGLRLAVKKLQLKINKSKENNK